MSAPYWDWEEFADDEEQEQEAAAASEPLAVAGATADAAADGAADAADCGDAAATPDASFIGAPRMSSAASLSRKLQRHPNLAVSGNPAMGPLLLFDMTVQGVHLDRTPGLACALVVKCGPHWVGVSEAAVPLSVARPGEPESEEEWQSVVSAGGGGVVQAVRAKFESSSSGGGGGGSLGPPRQLGTAGSLGGASLGSNASGASVRPPGAAVPPLQVRL